MKMDSASLAIGLKRLKASYPAATFDEMSVAAYSEALADFDGRDLIAASKVIVKQSKFFPSIAELIDAIEDCARVRFDAEDSANRMKRLPEVSGAPTISAAEGWARVRKGLEEQGVLPKMPAARSGDTDGRRMELQRQASELLRDSESPNKAAAAAQ